MNTSALVPTPDSGGVWTLSISGGGFFTQATDVFLPVGSNWTTVSATFLVVGDATDYVDGNGEILLEVSCDEPGSTQVGPVRQS